MGANKNLTSSKAIASHLYQLLTELSVASLDKVAFKLFVECVGHRLWVLWLAITALLSTEATLLAILLVALAIATSLSALIYGFLPSLAIALPQALCRDFLLTASLRCLLNLLRLVASVNLQALAIITAFSRSATIASILSTVMGRWGEID